MSTIASSTPLRGGGELKSWDDGDMPPDTLPKDQYLRIFDHSKAQPWENLIIPSCPFARCSRSGIHLDILKPIATKHRVDQRKIKSFDTMLCMDLNNQIKLYGGYLSNSRLKLENKDKEPHHKCP